VCADNSLVAAPPVFGHRTWRGLGSTDLAVEELELQDGDAKAQARGKGRQYLEREMGGRQELERVAGGARASSSVP
jgi:hypothetical protein